MPSKREITMRECPTCTNLARFAGLYGHRGYDSRTGIFFCTHCRKPFYIVLTENEYRRAIACWSGMAGSPV